MSWSIGRLAQLADWGRRRRGTDTATTEIAASSNLVQFLGIELAAFRLLRLGRFRRRCFVFVAHRDISNPAFSN
jgi:hypothetical protein